MDKELKNVIYKAKNQIMTKESAIGFFVMVILSKESLKYNFLVAEFVSRTLNIELAPYAIKSRAVMCSKCVKKVNSFAQSDINKSLKLAVEFISGLEELNNSLDKDDTENKKSNKAKNSLVNMNKWISAINDRIKK